VIGFMAGYIAFTLNVAFAALNLGLFIDSHRWYSLSAAAFCGALGVWTLVMEAVSRL
jgi:hypothetical protein